ncbi:RNA helicase aquarius isoform X2, partial [Tanacetum coccineum]
RYFKPLVADVAVVAKCHLCVLYRHEKGKLVAHFLASFIQEDTKGLFSPDICIVEMELKELALANIGAIHKRADLSKKLYVLSPDELRDLVCNKLKLVLKNDPWTERVDFLNEAIVSF